MIVLYACLVNTIILYQAIVDTFNKLHVIKIAFDENVKGDLISLSRLLTVQCLFLALERFQLQREGPVVEQGLQGRRGLLGNRVLQPRLQVRVRRPTVRVQRPS